MILAIKNILDWIILTIEKFSSGKYWALKLTLSAFILSLFTAFPSYDVFFKNYEQNKHHWHGIHDQINNPFTFIQYSELHHSANTTFRLTVPVIANLVGLGSADLVYQILFCLAIQLISLFVLLWAASQISYKITNDKVTSCLITFAFALIYTGNSLPGDLWGGMDVVGFCFLALAILSNNSILIILFTALASFNDERALICSCLIFLWHTIRNKNHEDIHAKEIFIPNMATLSVVIGWMLYFILVYLLKEFRGFKLNTFTSDTALIVMKEDVSNIPFGIWSALEGFWLIVLGACLILIIQKRWLTLFLLSGGIFIVTFVSFCILDITRSIAHIFPVIFVCLYIIFKKENLFTVRYITLIAAIICLFPTYYVYGEHGSKWLYPFPLHLLRMLTGGETFTLTF